MRLPAGGAAAAPPGEGFAGGEEALNRVLIRVASVNQRAHASRTLGVNQVGVMKITLDLPLHLVRQVKQRALQEGRTLRELVADSIRLGRRGGTQALRRSAHRP